MKWKELRKPAAANGGDWAWKNICFLEDSWAAVFQEADALLKLWSDNLTALTDRHVGTVTLLTAWHLQPFWKIHS